MSTLLLTSVELRAVLARRYPFCSTWVMDKDYNVPDVSAMAGYFKEIADHLVDQYGDDWQEFFDCDNFALEAIVLAYRKHFLARRTGAGSGQGIAVGIVCFLKDPRDQSTAHAIAFWVDAFGDIHEFEPQNRQPLPLTDDQCASAYFCFVS